jgi:hypothetical protein
MTAPVKGPDKELKTMFLPNAPFLLSLFAATLGAATLPTLHTNNNVTWTNPSSSRPTFNIDMGLGQTFYWTNGSTPGNGIGVQVYTADPNYGTFTATKGGRYSFFVPKDKDVSDFVTKNRKGNQLNAEAFTNVALGPIHLEPIDDVPQLAFAVPLFGSLSGDGPPIYMGLDLSTYIDSNPNAFGNYALAASLADLGLDNIVNGQIPSIAGLYFATGERGLDPNLPIGFAPLRGSSADWLNSAAYESAYGLIGVTGSLTSTATPEPSSGLLLLICLSLLAIWRWRVLVR